MKNTSLLFFLLIGIILISCEKDWWNSPEEQISQASSLLEKVYMEDGRIHDSAYFFARNALTVGQELHNDSLISLALLRIGEIRYAAGSPERSLEFFRMALEPARIALQNDPTRLLASRLLAVHNWMGMCLYDLQLKDLAIESFERTIRLADSLAGRVPVLISDSSRMILLFNLGSLYVNLGEDSLGTKLFDRVAGLNERFRNKGIESGLLAFEGSRLAGLGDFRQGVHLIKMAMARCDTVSLPHCKLALYNRLAQAYFGAGKYGEARNWALRVLREAPGKSSFTPALVAMRMLDTIFQITGDFPLAHRYLTQWVSLRDSLDRARHPKEVGGAMMRRDFEEELRQEHEAHHRELREIRVTRILFISASLILAMLVVIISLGWRNRRIQIDQERLKRLALELEHRNLELEKKSLQSIVGHKDRELASMSLGLIHKREVMENLSGVVRRLLDDPTDQVSKEKLNGLLNDLKLNREMKTHMELEIRFREVYPGFYEELLARFPNLSPNEKKLCTYLRMNLTTKDISALTGQTPLSIKMARTRLRKKMGLAPDVNLVGYLEGIVPIST